MSKFDNFRENDSKSVDDIEKLINENSSEHQQLLESFKNQWIHSQLNAPWTHVYRPSIFQSS